jgi:apolipoprotein N-acyltransferase
VAASAVAFALYARVEPVWVALGWIGLVPFLAALDRATTVGGALAISVLMAIAFVLAAFNWFATAIATYTGVPFGLAVLVMVVAAPLIEPQFLTFAVARHLTREQRLWYRMLAGACVYVGTEYAYPKIFADTLAHGLHAAPWLRQAADLSGVRGLTFVLLIANECVLAAARNATLEGPARMRLRRALAPATYVAALACALGIYGALRVRELRTVDPTRPSLTAGLVQADISHYDRLRAEIGTFAAVRTILDAHFALSIEALERGDLDLLVWPETVYPTTFGTPKSADGAAFDREIAAFAARAGVPLVFGAYDVEDGHEFNAAVFLEPPALAEGRSGRATFETYRKARLFPLTERVPAALDSALLRRWLPWLGTWTPGPGPRVVPLVLADGRTLRVAPLICYDALDPALVRAAVRQGADVIVTLSNDSWYAVGTGPRLHLAGAAFLSIETRRPQLRATNTGISATIDATGEVGAVAWTHERVARVATIVPRADATSVVLAYGDWLGPSALATGLASMLAPLVRSRSRSAPTERRRGRRSRPR